MLAALVAAVVVVADQSTKTWAVHRLARGPIHVIWKLDLQLGFNTGAAFSILQGNAAILAVVALVLVGVLIWAVRRSPTYPLAASLGLVVGGALGNLGDRVLRSYHGGVVDWIALHFWPTFNVADACIVVGSLWTAFLVWRSDTARR